MPAVAVLLLLCAPVDAHPVNAATSHASGLRTMAVENSGGSGEALPAGVSRSWWASVKRQIKGDGYSIVRGKGQFKDEDEFRHAHNRSQGLRISFTRAGFEAAPAGGDGGWTWGLHLSRCGFKGDLKPVDRAVVTVSENRVSYARGDLTEWYVNDEKGLEQGFTLKRRPQGEAPAGDMLLFEMAVVGDLQAEKGSGDLEEISFTTETGRTAMRYGHLKAYDARGKVLPSALLVSGPKTIQIRVDTGNAVYPITVDPLATTAAWTQYGGSAYERFGYSVATAGDVNGDGYSDVIVGAPYYDPGAVVNAGRAYVYYGSASGLAATAAWTRDGADGERFGWSVATAGDVNGDGYGDVIVGAPGYDSNKGRASVYYGSEDGLLTTAAWTEYGDSPGEYFGYSVATAGDVKGNGYSDVIVGAPYYSSYSGRAYVYYGFRNDELVPVDPGEPLKITHDSTGDYFGWSVATAGDVNGDGYSDVIVGAPYHDPGALSNAGRAYVYYGSASGLDTGDPDDPENPLTRDGRSAGEGFGRSVATAGDVDGDGYSDVIVGAPFYSSNTGRAYVFHGSDSPDSGLGATAAWTKDGDSAGDYFGYSVATAGDVNGDGYGDVIVGAYGYSSLTGVAYVYHGASSGLGTTAAWTKDGDSTGDYFGWSVATAGDVNGDGYSDVIVGAPYYDHGGSTNAGRAYVFLGSPSSLDDEASFTEVGEGTSNYLGFSVAAAGDVNGDGYSDVIVGAFGYNSDAGRAYVYHGTSSGLGATAAWTKDGAAGERFGFSVATAGDVNGDGYSDVIVGAYCHDSHRGRAYVYHGSASGLAETEAWTKDGAAENSYFGYCVATAGDVNGDGYSDVIVGAYNSNIGRAYVYHGASSGLAATAAWTKDGEGAGVYFGRSVASAGDVNGDGYGDVIVGAPAYSSNRGRAYVYHGAASGLAATAAWTMNGEEPQHFFGLSVATAGDVNGDGYGDCIVGAFGYNYCYGYCWDACLSGRGYVYHGTSSGLPPWPAWTKAGFSYVGFGRSVAAAGDVNGDGYSDVIVGAYFLSSYGGAFVYHGTSSGLGAALAWAKYGGGISNNRFGYCAATAGDVNGDGYSDVIVGDYGFTTNTGRAVAYYGNGGRGLSLTPQQRRYSDTAPIVHLSESDKTNAFRVAVTGRTPFGRGKVKLQWEVKPLGTAFNGSGTQTSAAWADTGVSGASLSESTTGLTQDTCYHWRARLIYHPATTPFQPFSRWLSPFGNGAGADLRTHDQATLAELVSFSAHACVTGECIRITWKTASELDTAGFHIHRSEKEEGPYTRITDRLIPAAGGAVSGSSYAHEDRDAAPYGSWYYKLEVVDESGAGTLYGPVQGSLGRAGDCPECAGTPCTIRDVTFLAGKVYDCTYDRPVRLGPGVRVQKNASLTLHAPGIEFGRGFHAEPGSTVKSLLKGWDPMNEKEVK